MFQELCDFLGGSLLRYVTSLPCLVVIYLVQVEFICHVASWDHVIKGLHEILFGRFSFYVIILSSLVVIGIVAVEICF